MPKFTLLLVTGLVCLGSCSGETTQGAPTSPALKPVATDTVANTTTPGNVATPSPDSTTVDTESKPAATQAEAITTTSSADTVPAPNQDDVYAQPTSWICRADTDDVCDQSAPLTAVAPDGALTVQDYSVPVDAPIDCFYVYPTISADETYNSDMSADSELAAVIFQAQRFNQVCKVYAPVYRSVTSAGLGGRVAPQDGEGWQLAYGDVLAAWRHYLANDNRGRPVVLLSHSQGSFHLVKLLSEEIDPHPDQRQLVVSALLAGTSFQVALGKDVGGDTQNMPLCRRTNQFGCVVTFQTYRDGTPPQPGALFGAPSGGTESACVNPAALAGGPAILESAMSVGDWTLKDPSAVSKITTNFVDTPGLITGECKVLDGYSYLAVTINADPNDARGDDINGDGAPNWGLHTVDLNIAQESLIDLVRSQSVAYLAAK